MSAALFPTLPGLTWDLTLSPTFSTIIQKSSTRQEARLQQDPSPLYELELNFDFLRDDPTRVQPSSKNPRRHTELAQLIGFYNQRGGAFDSFLLDPCIITGKADLSHDQGVALGVGDGVTTNFQLMWNWGDFSDQIQAVKGTPEVYANGAIASGWTLQPLGMIQFAVAPAAGVNLTADARWYWKVRFSDDKLGVKAFMFNLYECQSVKLQQVRDE